MIDWLQVVPTQLRETYIREEAIAVNGIVQEWMNSDNNDELRNQAMAERQLFLLDFLAKHRIQNHFSLDSRRDPVAEAKLRCRLIQKNAEYIREKLTDVL